MFLIICVFDISGLCFSFSVCLASVGYVSHYLCVWHQWAMFLIICVFGISGLRFPFSVFGISGYVSLLCVFDISGLCFSFSVCLTSAGYVSHSLCVWHQWAMFLILCVFDISGLCFSSLCV